MRDLWKGLALLALDTDLRKGVINNAKFDNRQEFARFDQPPNKVGQHLQNQPNVGALREIDAIYRTRGLFLGVYALAEINRWVLDGKDEFVQALDDFKKAIAKSVDIGASIQSPHFLEAVGALVADPLLKEHFARGERNLRDEGFALSPLEETALRDDFAPGGAADTVADLIFRLGWPGSSCEARILIYENLFHFNQ